MEGIILFDTFCRLGEFLKGLFDNLTKTSFRSMIIFLRPKILIYDNLIYEVLMFNDKSNYLLTHQTWMNVQ
jgi:hypothetical protein